MAKSKGITARTISAPTKIPPIWQIGILFPDGRKLVKNKCTLNELFNTYFINLDNYISKGFTGEELLKKYQDNYKNKNIKVAIQYVDSWGHTWKGKVAWPRESKFVEYLNGRLEKN